MLCIYTLSVMDAASGTPCLALAERFPSWGIESPQSLVQVLSCGCHFPNDSSKTCRLTVCLVAQGSLCWEGLLQNVVWNLKVRRWWTPLGPGPPSEACRLGRGVPPAREMQTPQWGEGKQLLVGTNPLHILVASPCRWMDPMVSQTRKSSKQSKPSLGEEVYGKVSSSTFWMKWWNVPLYQLDGFNRAADILIA